MCIMTIYFEDEDGDVCTIVREAEDHIDAESRANTIMDTGFVLTDNTGRRWFYGPHTVRTVCVEAQ